MNLGERLLCRDCRITNKGTKIIITMRNELTQNQGMSGKEISSLVFLGLAILYDLSPIDIIPDIPIVGWLDDATITLTTGLNCIQQFTAQTSSTLSNIAKTLKWLVIIIGGILVALLALVVVFFIKSVSN